ncbi:MAG TPA: M23 family metallopeptidase [Thermoanaerobaculia bacterium]
MRKAPVVAAALAAALFLLVLPASSEARSRHRGRVSKQALHARVMRQSSARTRARAREIRAASSLLAGGPVGRRGKAARDPIVIHQTDNGEVVLDSVEVATAEAAAALAAPTASAVPAAPTDPFPETYEYPQAPCPAEDPVIEAHVHVADADTPEKPEDEMLARPDPPRIARIARRLSSFFRPKSAAARVHPRDVDLSELVAANFLLPVEGVDRDKLRDSFLESRGEYARHLAIDIGAPRGTPVLATTDGEIIKLSREGRGGITIYQKDATGRYLFFYCHLSRYARGLRPGQQVEKGEVIGYVGATGHVIGGPHLHFSITRRPEDDDNFREGLAINPYLLFLAGVP